MRAKSIPLDGYKITGITKYSFSDGGTRWQEERGKVRSELFASNNASSLDFGLFVLLLSIA